MKSISYVMKPFDSKKEGKWIGFKENRDIFLEVYIQKKYGKDLHYLPFVDLGFKEFDKNINDLYLVDYGFQRDTPDDYYIWFLQHPFETIPQRYYDLYKNTKKRFTIYPLIFREHILLFLYDRKTDQIELFDNINTYSFIIKNDKNLLIYFFRKIYGDKVTFKFELNTYKKIGKIEFDRCDPEKYPLKITF